MRRFRLAASAGHCAISSMVQKQPGLAERINHENAQRHAT
jgi:hypothetical protein